MVIFLLLLIVAILLFGASALIGALGVFLGIMTFAASMVALSIWLQIEIAVLFLIFLGAVLLGYGVNAVLSRRSGHRAKKQWEAKLERGRRQRAERLAQEAKE